MPKRSMPPGSGLLSKTADLVAQQGQVAGGGEAARPAADDRDLLVEGDGSGLGQRHVLNGPVGDEALEAGDGDGLVDLAAGAVRLALVCADAAADGGEGVRLAGHAIGLREAAVADERYVALRAGVHGAGALAGRVALLGDRVGVGDGLRIELVDGLAFALLLVERIGHLHRADRDALAAAGADRRVDVPGVVVDARLEVAGLASQAGELGVGDDLDVEVAAGLDELGGKGAHRAVVGGEGLVELSHVPAEGGGFFHEVDLVPAFGQVEGALDARHAAAEDKGGAGGRAWSTGRHTVSFVRRYGRPERSG